MERCPHCRAKYKQGDTCRRCGADLSILLAIEARAETLSGLAIKKIFSGDRVAALKKAQAGNMLQQTLFSRALVGFMEDFN